MLCLLRRVPRGLKCSSSAGAATVESQHCNGGACEQPSRHLAVARWVLFGDARRPFCRHRHCRRLMLPHAHAHFFTRTSPSLLPACSLRHFRGAVHVPQGWPPRLSLPGPQGGVCDRHAPHLPRPPVDWLLTRQPAVGGWVGAWVGSGSGLQGFAVCAMLGVAWPAGSWLVLDSCHLIQTFWDRVLHSWAASCKLHRQQWWQQQLMLSVCLSLEGAGHSPLLPAQQPRAPPTHTLLPHTTHLAISGCGSSKSQRCWGMPLSRREPENCARALGSEHTAAPYWRCPARQTASWCGARPARVCCCGMQPAARSWACCSAPALGRRRIRHSRSCRPRQPWTSLR